MSKKDIKSILKETKKAMTKQELIDYCTDTYGTAPDFPFEDDCDVWMTALTEAELFHAADSYTPERGNLVFADKLLMPAQLKIGKTPGEYEKTEQKADDDQPHTESNTAIAHIYLPERKGILMI